MSFSSDILFLILIGVGLLNFWNIKANQKMLIALYNRGTKYKK